MAARGATVSEAAPRDSTINRVVIKTSLGQPGGLQKPYCVFYRIDFEIVFQMGLNFCKGLSAMTARTTNHMKRNAYVYY